MVYFESNNLIILNLKLDPQKSGKIDIFIWDLCKKRHWACDCKNVLSFTSERAKQDMITVAILLQDLLFTG